MAYTILSEKYPPRKPKLDIEADSIDDVTELTNVAEGSTCTVGDKTYEYDALDGWVEHGSGGGGGVFVVNVEEEGSYWTCDKTWKEIKDAFLVGPVVLIYPRGDNLHDELVVGVAAFPNEFSVSAYNNSFTATTENGYPQTYFD